MFIVTDRCALNAVRATMRETTPHEDHYLIDELLDAAPELVEKFYLPAIACYDEQICRETGATRPMAYTAMAHELTTNTAIANDPLLGGVAPNIKHFIGLSDEILLGKKKFGWAAEHSAIAFYKAMNILADNSLR